MLGVTDSEAKLWVDCKPIKYYDGLYEAHLQPRGQYDVSDGYLSVAQKADTPIQYPVRNSESSFRLWVQ